MDTIDKINQRLRAMKMSGAELTRAIGLKSTGTWSQWNNRMTSPSRKNLIAIASVLKCDVADLMPDMQKPATSGDGVVGNIKRLSPALQDALLEFLALAQGNPDTAERLLLFAVQELRFDAQRH